MRREKEKKRNDLLLNCRFESYHKNDLLDILTKKLRSLLTLF